MTHYPLRLSFASLRRISTARALLILCFGLLLPYWCDQLHQGIAGLLFFAIGVWPYAARCQTDADGLHFSWLRVRERVAWEEVLGYELLAHSGVLQRPAVEIALRSGASIVVRGERSRLAVLARDVGAHMDLRAANDIGADAPFQPSNTGS